MMAFGYDEHTVAVTDKERKEQLLGIVIVSGGTD